MTFLPRFHQFVRSLVTFGLILITFSTGSVGFGGSFVILVEILWFFGGVVVVTVVAT